MTRGKEIICDTLLEFLDHLALCQRMQLQGSSHRNLFGFVDLDTENWILLPERVLAQAPYLEEESLKRLCARFEKTLEEIIPLLQTKSGISELIQTTKAR
jgi:hypothetical protein